MIKQRLFKPFGLTLGCAALLLLGHTAGAAQIIRANGGTTFANGPTENPAVFTHTVDGIAQVFPVGNCKFHADVLAQFPSDPTEPIALNGTFTLTSADGNHSLNATVTGAASPDPNNPQQFVNFHYWLRFTGGTGQFSGARGSGMIRGWSKGLRP